MSLILDALRKSEAERQRGKSPGLFATTPGVQRETFPRMKLWPVLVFLAFLLASAWVIWRGESRRADSEQAALAVTQPGGTGIDVVDAGTGPDDRADAAARTIAAAATTAPTASAPAVDTAAHPRAIQLATPPGAIAAPPAPASTVSAAPPIPVPISPPPAAATDISPDTPAAESLPTVAVLDSGTRASLPPLKLSMHVFGQDPAKRFAIIDGTRVSAGSLLGNGVVEEIRRDGVVISVNGQRLLVPKP